MKITIGNNKRTHKPNTAPAPWRTHVSSLASLLTMGLFIAASFPVSSRAATLRVPQDKPTIQAAVTAAADGDTILISNGTYNESNIEVTKNLSISSVNGATNTVLDIQRAGRGFVIRGTSTTTARITGLTLICDIRFTRLLRQFVEL